MEKDVRGWCLGKDSSGTPNLSECVLAQGVGGRFFTTMLDRDGNPITIRSFQLGESFFDSKVEALAELVERLATEVTKHQVRVLKLGRQLEVAKKELELEREARDGSD